ncbi:MAG: hypothetical protein F4226_02330 [Synechococcus sp. SB0678_bin_12]|nr:hypothetical protein [Synechococcus sp. SB0678_bin_12]
MPHNRNGRHHAGGVLALLTATPLPPPRPLPLLLRARIVTTGIPGSSSSKRRRRMLTAASLRGPIPTPWIATAAAPFTVRCKLWL